MAQWEEAYDDWCGGMKYKEIAEKYGVSESAVKSWAARYFKPKREAEASQKVATKGKKRLQPSGEKSQPATPRRRGGQKGNKNAVGNSGGGPPRNQYGVKHGAYCTVFKDVISPNEAAVFGEISKKSEEDMIVEEIGLLTIRELRLMEKINALNDPKLKGQFLDSVFRSEDKREFPGEKSKDPEQIAKAEEAREAYEDRVEKEITSGRRMPGHEYHLNTTTRNTYEMLQRLESELTKIQGRKERLIAKLRQFRSEHLSGDDSNGEAGMVVYLPDNGRGDRK